MDPLKSKSYVVRRKQNLVAWWDNSKQTWDGIEYPETESATPPVYTVDEEWRIDGNKIIPKKPKLYSTGVLHPMDAKYTFVGTGSVLTLSVSMPVPDLLQVWLGAPAVVRVTVRTICQKNSLLPNVDYIVGVDGVLRNYTSLPPVALTNSKTWNRVMMCFVGNIAKINPKSNFDISLTTYYTSPPDQSSPNAMVVEYDVVSFSNYLQDSPPPYDNKSFKDFCVEEDVKAHRKLLERKYAHAEALGYFVL